MKVKELINTTFITRINIFIVPALFIVFIILGYWIYLARYSFIEQSGKLQSRVTAQQFVTKLEHITFQYVEYSKYYNVMVANYTEIDVDERREKISDLTKSMLYSNKNINALCVDFNKNKLDNKDYLFENIEQYPKDGHFCVYAERINEPSINSNDKDSIMFRYAINDAEVDSIFPEQLTPQKIALVGPYNWVDYNDTTKYTKMLTFWQPIWNNDNEIIGNTYLDIRCDDYYKNIKEISKNYNCDIFIFYRNCDTFIYHPDLERIGWSAKKDEIYSDSLDHLFMVTTECSFNEYNHVTGEKNLILVVPITVPQSSIELNVIVAFSYDVVMQSMNAFILSLVLILFVTYIIFVALIVFVGNYAQKKYSNEEIVFSNVERI